MSSGYAPVTSGRSVAGSWTGVKLRLPPTGLPLRARSAGRRRRRGTGPGDGRRRNRTRRRRRRRTSGPRRQTCGRSGRRCLLDEARRRRCAARCPAAQDGRPGDRDSGHGNDHDQRDRARRPIERFIRSPPRSVVLLVVCDCLPLAGADGSTHRPRTCLTWSRACPNLAPSHLKERNTNPVTVRRDDIGQRSETVRRANLSAIVRELHVNGPLSRSELVARTGLTRSAIRGLIGELVAADLASEGRPARSVRRAGHLRWSASTPTARSWLPSRSPSIRSRSPWSGPAEW